MALPISNLQMIEAMASQFKKWEKDNLTKEIVEEDSDAE
jgi:hypothetical protein